MSDTLISISRIIAFRRFFLKMIEPLNLDQMNRIPDGYNNNIAWHLGHLTSVLELLCYQRSGLPANVAQEWIEEFKNGSRPERVYTQPDIEEMKSQLLRSATQLEVDYAAGHFNGTTYSPSEVIATRYGVPASNIDEAIAFMVFHEGMHTGYVMAMKHLV